MNTYLVWDELNDSEETASEIEGMDPADAAENYAEQDVDGQTDGIYCGPTPKPISVKSPDGTVKRFGVHAESQPVFYAVELT